MSAERQPDNPYMTFERELARKNFTGVLDAFTGLTDDKIMTADELFRYVIHFVEAADDNEVSEDQKVDTFLRFREHIDLLLAEKCFRPGAGFPN